MIRALRDAIGTLLGWAFQTVVNALWPKRKDDTNKDGEPGS